MTDSRWSPGERLHDVLASAVADRPAGADAVAVELSDGALRFSDLLAWSDAVAAALADEVAAGDRVALLFDRSPKAWAAMLALSKLGASWVPLDMSFPGERIAFIVEDAAVQLVLAAAEGLDRLAALEVPVRLVPDHVDRPTAPFVPRETVDEVAYVIYTSGTSGRPKGVPIRHEAFCSFLRVAAECYGYRPDDRVYQGLTIAFDFSVEEIWVPLVAGARLLPPPEGVALVGDELAAFLADNRISALCCVPTLLASITTDLPELRLVLVSGESCPAQLVSRWARDGRRMVNLYGPTEATVSATWAVLDAAEPVTIGRALPTYRVDVLVPGTTDRVPDGQEGELVITGIGVATGYLNRPELTAKAFVPDVGGRTPHRSYRTGDLVRTDEQGRLVYLGRLDSQVKVRGYRIELDEIESVLLAQPGVSQAAVAVVKRPGSVDALAGYWTSASDDHPRADVLLDALRSRLPAYMVPATMDRLDLLPMLPSHKVDRAALPAPRSVRPAADARPVRYAGEQEELIAKTVARVLGIAQVGPTADLFTDLGADSFTVARICAELRALTPAAITTRAVYAHPTVRALAVEFPALEAEPDADPAAAPVRRGARLPWLATGTAQTLLMLGFLALVAAGIDRADQVLSSVSGFAAYGVTVGITAAVTLAAAGAPIALKWLLIGRWRAAEIPAWGLGYLRFWIVRMSLRLSPMRLLAGSPFYVLFLRALGARVGRNALILTNRIPVCADLVRIGDDAVIAPDVKLDAYRVRDGLVETGRVEIGARATVGHGSHLDIGTAIGDGGRLAHASALLEGQSIPEGRAWHGSPALDAGPAPTRADTIRIGTSRRVVYSAIQLSTLLLITGPVAIAVAVWADDIDVFDPLQAAWFAAVLFAGAWLVRALVPRLLARTLEPGRDYPVYTTRWAGLRTATRVANSPILNELFGDSSAIVWYLRSVGVRFRSVLQTGSNLGTAQHFDLPSWCSIGGGTLISDGLAMPNAEFSSSTFRVHPISVGERVFMGNGVVYPPGAGVGDDVLLATKVMVPVDGTVRTGVGLLGSPAFEVPRTVRRDAAYASARTEEERRRALGRKNRHNAVTAVVFLLHRFLVAYLAILVVGLVDVTTTWDLFLALVGTVVAELGLLVVTDLLCRGFRRLRPLTCSLYEPSFWRHERYWKLSDPKALAVFDGTPWKPLLWRLLGVRVGRMLLDDGVTMPERSMVVLGDDVTLGAGSTLHGHSLEDGVFKSGPIAVGDGSTVGASALVHYGVEIGAGARIAPDAFLMKGEQVRDGETWAGNPAHPAPGR